LLGDSVASVNSALFRARSLIRDRLSDRRLEWSRTATPTDEERKVLERYMDATDRADSAALAVLLRDEVRLTMPPFPTWFQGLDDIVRAFEFSTDPSSSSYLGRLRTVATAANRQPAVAAYVQRPGQSQYQALGVDVLRLDGDRVIEITRFVNPNLFSAFGLPSTL
jgi:RNA polymerase sigma-70 factor (ECF subfamily)